MPHAHPTGREPHQVARRDATIVEAGGSPSSEAPPGRLIRQALDRLPTWRRGVSTQGELARVSRTSKGGRGAAVHRESGNPVVLGSEVGCRSR